MALQRAGRHLEEWHREHLVGVDMGVHAHDPPVTGFDLALEPVCRVRDLALRIAVGDRRDHPTPRIDLVQVAPDLALGPTGRGDAPPPRPRWS
jgi:hypothetical protein